MLIGLPLFAHLAAVCAPQVAVPTLAAVAAAESAFDPNAVHENGPGAARHAPATPDAAAALAARIIARGGSVDLGLMQINSANLARLGLNVREAFDPCRSLAAGARVLQEGWAAARTDRGPQYALRETLSRYNTGTATRGFANGYVARVQAAADAVVPAIQPGMTAPSPAVLPAPADARPVPEPRCLLLQAEGRRLPAPIPCPRSAPDGPRVVVLPKN